MSSASSSSSTRWASIRQIPDIKELYGPHFPLEVRDTFASLIEGQPWQSVSASDRNTALTLTQHLQKAVADHASQLMVKANLSSDEEALAKTLSKFATTIQQTYMTDPLALAKLLKICLEKENEMAQRLSRKRTASSSVGQDDSAMPAPGTRSSQSLTEELDAIVSAVSEAQSAQEAFVIEYQDLCKLDSYLQQLQMHIQQIPPAQAQMMQQQYQLASMQKTQADAQLASQAARLRTLRQTPKEQLDHLVPRLQQDQAKISSALDEWACKTQQGALSKQDSEDMLQRIQGWAEQQIDTLLQLRQQTRCLCVLQTQLPLDPNEPPFAPILSTINTLIAELVHRTFIVDQQPPQVLKTQTKFAAGARFLLGTKLSMYLQDVDVTACIISESQVMELQDQLKRVCKGEQVANHQLTLSGDLINNRKPMMHVVSKKMLHVKYKNLSLKNIRRRDARSDTVVTEEKFAIAFRSSFVLCNGELNFDVCARSIPVVVVVHGNQFPNAEATVLWDRSFCEPERRGYEVPTSVTWARLAPALSSYFASEIGHPLSSEHLSFLQTLLPLSQDKTVTWQQFNKVPLTGRPFAFWEWFYAASELVKKHMSGPWSQGLLHGFISKSTALSLLEGKPVGTFLLRFSLSELGAITVAWVGKDPYDNVQVFNLQPWSAKDFTIRSLSNRLKDLHQLQFLFPDVPKDTAFEPFYTTDQPTRSSQMDYVMSGIAAVIPQLSALSTSTSAGSPAPSSTGNDQGRTNTIYVRLDEPEVSTAATSSSATSNGTGAMFQGLAGTGAQATGLSAAAPPTSSEHSSILAQLSSAPALSAAARDAASESERISMSTSKSS